MVVVSFERGIFGDLPRIVAELRQYMQSHDIDFTALAAPE